MSLHDKYFSSKNKQHVYSLICDLVLKESGQDIQEEDIFLDITDYCLDIEWICLDIEWILFGRFRIQFGH